MRDIKFRVFIKGENRMIYDVVIHQGMVCADLNKDKWWIYTEEDSDVIVMQNTGLTDKNGLDIYEGDIVLFWATSYLDCMLNGEDTILNPKMGVVVWNEELMKFEVDVDGEFINNFSKSYDDKKMEVNGNIYEHPELI